MNSRKTDYHWYALQVRRRLERVAASHLTDKGYEGYLPMYKSRPLWPDQTRTLEAPLFTGYTFCRLNVRQRLSVLLVPGVLSIAGVGKVPKAIPDEEILSIQTVIASGLVCGPWSKPSEGQRVRVERGPLEGLEGTVVRVQSAFQLIVALPLIQRSVFVRIDKESIEVRPELLLEVAPTSNGRNEPFHGHA